MSYSYDRRITAEEDPTAAKSTISPMVGEYVRHAITFLQNTEKLIKHPQEMHGLSAEQMISNSIASTIEMLKGAAKALPPPSR